MKQRPLFKPSLILVLLWLGTIWIMSSIPSANLPSIKIFSSDKIAHFGVYFILGLLLNRWLRAKGFSRKTVMLVYALLFLNAALDEWHQTFIPGRSVSLWDLLANFSGIMAARLTLRVSS